MENGAETENAGTENAEVNPVREDARKLFIGGLSWDTYETDIKEYFSTFGEVERVSLKKDPYTQKSRGFAFVLFKNPEPIDKILDGTTKHVIKGKKVEPNRAKSRPAKIFVGGLNTEMSDDDIKSHFTNYGKITEVEMPFDKQKNQRKGFCFITFENEDIMKEALKESKQTICGKQVDVKKATPKPDSGGFGMMDGGRGGRGGRGRGRGGRGGGRGGFQGAWDPYGSYGGGYGGYDYGGSQVAPPKTTYFDSSSAGYDNYGGGYGGGDYYGGGGFNGGYAGGGYGGGGYGGGKQMRGRGQRPAPY